ncbi:MAG: hypothetical protein PHV17_07625 [Candidatus Omnitrophica bacterium]|nr:hypothetical protein [Candidatus Omnitrophota bacterium]
MTKRLVFLVAGLSIFTLAVAGCSEQKNEVERTVKDLPNEIQQIKKTVVETSKAAATDIQLTAKKTLAEAGKKIAESSKEAIAAAGSLANVQEKKDYLINQAKTLYDSKKFQDVVDIAQYILQSLDTESSEAKSLLEKARQALVEKTQAALNGAVGDIKAKLPGSGQ